MQERILPLGKVIGDEKKTRRVQLLMQPSVYDAISDIANEKDMSVNELVNGILREYASR